MSESPEPDDLIEPPRPSLQHAVNLLERAANDPSYDRANCLANQALAWAAVCQAVAIEQQVMILGGIRDRLDHMIRQSAKVVRTRPAPPPAPPVPPTFSQR